jgi:hypothetical protein
MRDGIQVYLTADLLRQQIVILTTTILIQNGLLQGDALSLSLFNFALEYAIKKIQENQMGLKLIGTHQLLIYAVYVNLLGDNIDIIKKNAQTLRLVRRLV